MLCMFQKCCTFAPSKQKDDNRSLILGYGVMVTQQILVLFFLVRVRVAQLHLQRSRATDSGPVFLGSSPSSPTEKGVLSNRDTFFVSSFYFLFQIEIFFLTFL